MNGSIAGACLLHTLRLLGLGCMPLNIITQTLVKTILLLSPDALHSPASTRHTGPGSIDGSGFAIAYEVSFVLCFR